MTRCDVDGHTPVAAYGVSQGYAASNMWANDFTGQGLKDYEVTISINIFGTYYASIHEDDGGNPGAIVETIEGTWLGETLPRDFVILFEQLNLTQDETYWFSIRTTVGFNLYHTEPFTTNNMYAADYASPSWSSAGGNGWEWMMNSITVNTFPVAESPWASGGDEIYTNGDYTVHIFNTEGTLVCGEGSIEGESLVIAGGGGGSSGGGGAGGVLSGAETLTENMDVTVGDGGIGGKAQSTNGNNGEDSAFGTRTAVGGGGGGKEDANGLHGGSGGGSGDYGTRIGGVAEAGQGYDGGTNNDKGSPYPAPGGGGAGGIGKQPIDGSHGGIGGIGIENDISGNLIKYAGGGGGGTYNTGGIGGPASHGGAKGNGANQTPATAPVNKGGGGGGCGSSITAGTGGTGVVIIRYLTPAGGGNNSKRQFVIPTERDYPIFKTERVFPIIQ